MLKVPCKICTSTKQTNKYFVLKLISLNGGQLQISEWAVTKQETITK